MDRPRSSTLSRHLSDRATSETSAAPGGSMVPGGHIVCMMASSRRSSSSWLVTRSGERSRLLITSPISARPCTAVLLTESDVRRSIARFHICTRPSAPTAMTGVCSASKIARSSRCLPPDRVGVSCAITTAPPPPLGPPTAGTTSPTSCAMPSWPPGAPPTSRPKARSRCSSLRARHSFMRTTSGALPPPSRKEDNGRPMASEASTPLRSTSQLFHESTVPSAPTCTTAIAARSESSLSSDATFLSSPRLCMRCCDTTDTMPARSSDPLAASAASANTDMRSPTALEALSGHARQPPSCFSMTVAKDARGVSLGAAPCPPPPATCTIASVPPFAPAHFTVALSS
mmetsp:Transcript_18517/g.57505  ORF Transcript_18517/g.57505 Transcript_18517/m.57505 type:complete len:344 (-) Transcript_18517:1059-2090(-)